MDWKVCGLLFFFFQAEDGIRDGHVTGVQTCALPILTESSCRTTIRSAWMMSETWVSTTFPSKVATFFASSEIMLSDSMLIGLSRSALSASADPAAKAHIAARPRAAAACALFPGWHIKEALDLRLQHELLFVVVHHHPDPCQDRASFGNRDRVIRTHDPLFGE